MIWSSVASYCIDEGKEWGIEGMCALEENGYVCSW